MPADAAQALPGFGRRVKCGGFFVGFGALKCCFDGYTKLHLNFVFNQFSNVVVLFAELPVQ